mmetsp:Transcript_107842/g.313864  ORF Transcript_107842/g.313864 Transcript_107842/m.313864 type:complete len:188 (-) Transcript_107842:18-581(-)
MGLVLMAIVALLGKVEGFVASPRRTSISGGHHRRGRASTAATTMAAGDDAVDKSRRTLLRAGLVGAYCIPIFTVVQKYNKPGDAEPVVPVVAIDGTYSDPQHAEGYRKITTVGGGAGGVVSIELQDKPKGPILTLVGTATSTGLTIDFSPKGGPKAVPAKFVAGAGAGAGAGGGRLEFPDGNAWTRR